MDGSGTPTSPKAVAMLEPEARNLLCHRRCNGCCFFYVWVIWTVCTTRAIDGDRDRSAVLPSIVGLCLKKNQNAPRPSVVLLFCVAGSGANVVLVLALMAWAGGLALLLFGGIKYTLGLRIDVATEHVRLTAV